MNIWLPRRKSKFTIKIQVPKFDHHATSILGNHMMELWETVKEINGGRIDFVLDNAGFELYCDCVYGE